VKLLRTLAGEYGVTVSAMSMFLTAQRRLRPADPADRRRSTIGAIWDGS